MDPFLDEEMPDAIFSQIPLRDDLGTPAFHSFLCDNSIFNGTAPPQ